MPTDCANDARPAELVGRVVLGVERGEPLHTSAAILLVNERITHLAVLFVDCVGRGVGGVS